MSERIHHSVAWYIDEQCDFIEGEPMTDDERAELLGLAEWENDDLAAGLPSRA